MASIFWTNNFAVTIGNGCRLQLSTNHSLLGNERVRFPSRMCIYNGQLVNILIARCKALVGARDEGMELNAGRTVLGLYLIIEHDILIYKIIN